LKVKIVNQRVNKAAGFQKLMMQRNESSKEKMIRTGLHISPKKIEKAGGSSEWSSVIQYSQ
jgi:hypothetical protein